MEYVITDHNDPERKFIVEYNGHTITVDYPMDIDAFENLSGILDIILPGILVSYIEPAPIFAQPAPAPIRALMAAPGPIREVIASMDAHDLPIGTSDNDIAGTFWNY
jgi:hypothetical protein